MLKDQVAWKNKLSIKIPVVIAIFIAIVMTITAVSVTVLIDISVKKMVNKELDYIADANSMAVEAFLDSMLTFSRANSMEVLRYRNLDAQSSEKMLIETLSNVLDDSKIFGVYYAFEPNAYFPDTPNGKSFYAYRDGDKVGVDIFQDFDSYGEADYYLPAKENRATHVTEPYVWELGNGKSVNLITLSTPILDKNGKFIGVANCDIDVSSLNSVKYENGGYKSSLTYVVTGEGICIAHALDKDVIGKVPSTVSDNPDILQAIKEGKDEKQSVKNPYMKNRKADIYHKAISFEGTDVNWSVAYAVDSIESNMAVIQIILALSLISVIGLVCLIFFSSKTVTKYLKPIGPVMIMAENMGSCRMKESKDIGTFDEDELGKLAEIFKYTSDIICEYMSAVSEVLDHIAKCDLDIQFNKNFQGDFHIVEENIITILDSLNATFTKIRDSAIQVTMGADYFSTSAQSMSQGAMEQANQIRDLSAKISEITQQVKEGADYAKEANNKAENVGIEIENSNKQMRELLLAMEKMTDTSAQIGNIIKTIEDIAFQTNILALNAAVEAARAGEAGKGFAVVADEVRNLASKSAEAAKDTTTLIESSMQSVSEGAKYANITAESLESVVSGTKEILSAIAEISGKTDMQTIALDEAAVGLNEISKVVHSNAALAEENAAASEELTNQAQLLHAYINEFKVRGISVK